MKDLLFVPDVAHPLFPPRLEGGGGYGRRGWVEMWVTGGDGGVGGVSQRGVYEIGRAHV